MPRGPKAKNVPATETNRRCPRASGKAFSGRKGRSALICGVTGDRIHLMRGKTTRAGRYKCKDCRKPFTMTIGTVVERSHIPLSKWVLAAQIMASS